MFYCNSICSLSNSLHLFRSLYQILLCYLFCSCFYLFILLLFGKDLMTLPVLYSFLSLFSFPLLSFCSFYASFLLLFLFFRLFSSLHSSLLYATPVFTIDLLLIFFILSRCPPVFLIYFYLYIYLFIFSLLLLFS